MDLLEAVLNNDGIRLSHMVSCRNHEVQLHNIFGILLQLAEDENLHIIMRILNDYASQLQSTEPELLSSGSGAPGVSSTDAEVSETRTEHLVQAVEVIASNLIGEGVNRSSHEPELQTASDNLYANTDQTNNQSSEGLQETSALLIDTEIINLEDEKTEIDMPGIVSSCPITYSVSDCMDYLVHPTHYDMLKQLIDSGLPVDVQDTEGKCLIHHAAAEDATEVLRMLLELGVDADVKDLQNVTPLMQACRNNSLSCVNLLLEHTNDLNHHDHCDQTALHYACKSDAVACAARLLDSGIHMQPSMHRETELMVALSHNAENIISLLIQYGVDVNACSRQNCSALHYAALYDCPSAVEHLRRAEATICLNRHNYTPIAIAAKNGHHRTLKALLEWYPEDRVYNIQTSSQKTPLQLAAIMGQYECVKLLLDAGAKVDYGTDLCSAAQGGSRDVLGLFIRTYKDRLGCDWYISTMDCVNMLRMSPLHVAAMHGYDDCVELLLQEKANPTPCMPITGETPLMLAVIKNYYRSAKLIVDAIFMQRLLGLNSMTPKHKTALHYAAKQGSVECVDLLVNSGAVIDVKDSQGYTPMLMAVQHGHYEVVRILLGANCDVKANKQHGWNGLHLAALNNHPECGACLLQAGLNPNATSWISHVSPAQLAAQKGHITILKLLLEHHANITLANDMGLMPIHHAAKNDHAECIHLLVLYRSPIDPLNLTGQTPLQLAAIQGSIHSLAMLILYNSDTSMINLVEGGVCRAVNYLEATNLLLQTIRTISYKDMIQLDDRTQDLTRERRTELESTTGFNSNIYSEWDIFLSKPTPVSLKQQCRVVIRSRMGKGLEFINGQVMLPIPTALQCYVAMKAECSPYASHI